MIESSANRRTLLGKQAGEVALGIAESALVDVSDAVEPLLAELELLDRAPLDVELALNLGERLQQLLALILRCQQIVRDVGELLLDLGQPVVEDDVLRLGLVDLRRVELGVLVQLSVVLGGDVDAILLSRGLSRRGSKCMARVSRRASVC
jgi:hypothetical protein